MQGARKIMQLEEKEDLNMMPIPAPEDDLDSDTVATIHNPQSEDFVQLGPSPSQKNKTLVLD